VAAAPAPEPELTVVIPTLGSYGTLARVLDGFARQDARPGSFEVVLVVDAAEPDPPAVAEAVGARSFPLRRLTGSIPGASANRNAGWRAARAPLVLFCDNDTIPVARNVSEHLAWHRRHPAEEVCVLGHVRWAPELAVTTFMRWLDRGMQFDFGSIAGAEATWGHFYTANASVKRTFLERVGGFDSERLPYPYEDTDWAYRASRLGLRVLYDRRAVVDHLRTMDLEFWKQRAHRVARAEHQFSRLHPELPPWYHGVFSHALTLPRPRGRGLRLAPYVPPWVPWLGPRVWYSVDVTYKQALAPPFLAAWDEIERETGRDGVQPDRSGREPESSAGSPPGGPK